MCVMANNRNEVIRKNLFQFKILDFCVREIDLEYLESVEREELERNNLFMKPQIISQAKFKEEQKLDSFRTPEEKSDYGDSDLSPFESALKHDPSSASKELNKIKPIGGFNFSLDLTNVKKKGEAVKVQKVENFKEPDRFDHELIERSSIGITSEQAHPIDISYKAKDESSEDSSSSSGYDFVPPPELNPNAYVPSKPKAPFSLGGSGKPAGLGFKLNLGNVPTANLITQEDKSRVEALNKDKKEPFIKTADLKINEEQEISGDRDIKMVMSNTTKIKDLPPKPPMFGGFGGFKLALDKVPTANLITEEDREKMKSKDLLYISKNNFTDTAEVKGDKPKKLNLKSKDSTTKITNEPSLPNLKVKKGKKAGKFKKGTKKEGRNYNANKMKSLVLENSEASSLFDSFSESDNKIPFYKEQKEGRSKNEIKRNLRNLTPNVVDKGKDSSSRLSKNSEGAPSDISHGSYVGSNRVFIPSLNIQKDVIEKQEEEKRKKEEEIKNKREKDKKNPRFQMQRQSKKKNKDLFSSNHGENEKEEEMPSPGHKRGSESHEFLEEKAENKSKISLANPLALNLSKVQRKGDPPVVKDNTFFELHKTDESAEKSDIKVIKESDRRSKRHDLTVTLGQNTNIDGQVLSSKLHDFKETQNLNFNVTDYFENTGMQSEMYKNEKMLRGIYHDDELHSLIIFLIFSLILTPQRGTLDDLYWSRHPVHDGKPPVLHFLHFHLNHPTNQSLIPMIMKKIEKQFTQNSGVKLLKLL